MNMLFSSLKEYEEKLVCVTKEGLELEESEEEKEAFKKSSKNLKLVKK